MSDISEMTEQLPEPLIPPGLPWIATVGLFVLVGAKVVSVSYGSPTTATALMASSGPLAIVMGTLVFELGSIGAWVLLILGLIGERQHLSSTDRVIVRGLAVTLWVVLSLLSWWAWLLVGAVVVDRVFGGPVGLWFLDRLPSRASTQESQVASRDDIHERLEALSTRAEAGEDVAAELEALDSEVDALKSRTDGLERRMTRLHRFESVFLTAMGTLTLVFFLLPAPWIAPQRVELGDGKQFVAYVVSDGAATDTVLLRDVDRRVLVIPSDDIARFELAVTNGPTLPG